MTISDHIRQVALVMALVIVLGAWAALAYWKHEAGVQRERADKAEAAAAQAQRTVEVVDRYHTETRIIHERGEREADALQQLPGATNAVDPDRRTALCDALSRLRDGQPACDDPGQPEGPVRPSEGGEPPH